MIINQQVSNLLIGLLGAIALASLYIFSPVSLQALDNSLRDILFKLRGDIPTSNQVVIIDIDEKSLAQLGQWPWEREHVAQLLNQLTQDGVGIIGLDIVFAEQDKTSPAYLNKKWALGLNDIIDYDQQLSEAIANTPTILGYVFQMETPTPKASMPHIPAIIIEKNRHSASYLLKPKGVLTNIPILQNAAYSSGFFNNVPDPSGMVRNVPLVMKYQDTLYPSLTLEMLRIALNSPKIQINYDENGIDNIQIADLKIPTNRHGQLFINYRGGAKSFQYISAIDVLKQNYNPKDIAGKWVLIGTSATGILDLRATPFDNSYPGVEVHANVIDNIISGDFLAKPNWIEALDLIIIMGLFIFAYLAFNLLSAFWLAVTSIGIFYALYWFIDNMLFSQGLVLNILFPLLALSLALVLSTLSNYFFETRQKNLVKTKLANKVSPAVMSELLKNPTQNIMQGHTREITVFFSDLRNFTAISEAIDNPQTLIKFLNLYTEQMTQVITDYHGTVDKFIGDAIMAYWNAPNEIHNHADLAVNASLEQLALCQQLNQSILQKTEFSALKQWCKQKQIQPIEIGIGINTGSAVIGEMGGKGRSDYTVIGDTVNLGARLESLCKYYGAALIISDYSKQSLSAEYTFQFLDKVTVKGKEKAVNLWQIHQAGEPSKNLKKELDDYHKAIQLYQQQQFEQAQHWFEKTSQQNPTNPKIYQIYIERCQQYRKQKPENFDGTFKHTSKA